MVPKSYVRTQLLAGARTGFPFALWALWAYLLVAIGRLAELAPGLANVPLAKIAIAGCLLGMVGGKNLQLNRKLDPPTRAISHTALALLGVAAFSVVISIWRSASLTFFLTSALVVGIGFFLTIKLCSDRRKLIATLYALVIIALAQVVVAIGARPGRISAGESYDPNDLAYLLVTALPIAMAFVSRTTGVKRTVNVVVVVLMILGVLLTQSRGGFLALIALILYIVFTPLPSSPAQPGQRAAWAKRLILLVAVSTVVWAVLPSTTRDRLATVVSLGSDYNTDTTLKTGRMAIWERNAKAALFRPIGFGIDAFGAVDLRSGGKFKAPHNSILEVFVELGFLGCFLYLRIYWLAWKSLAHPLHGDIEAEVFCRALKAAMVGNFVAGFFLSQAYSSTVWTLFALAGLAASFLGMPVPATQSTNARTAALRGRR